MESTLYCPDCPGAKLWEKKVKNTDAVIYHCPSCGECVMPKDAKATPVTNDEWLEGYAKWQEANSITPDTPWSEIMSVPGCHCMGN